MGYCKADNYVKIAKTMLHFWEEPVISGTKGSGAIFFSYCNLKCVFCQNYKISHCGKGNITTTKELAEIFQELEKKGAHNINLVTPTHYTDQIIEALNIYRPKIPIVWNTNSYESDETMEKIKNYIDIYLFDLKYYNKELSKKYSDTINYFEIATKNILKAKKEIPTNIIENNIMKKGIIIRHLILPNQTNDSIKILDWIKNNIPDTLISIMSQYTPYFRSTEFPEINRTITKLEYKRVLTHCQNLQLNGFMQDLTSANENFIPDFDT